MFGVQKPRLLVCWAGSAKRGGGRQQYTGGDKKGWGGGWGWGWGGVGVFVERQLYPGTTQPLLEDTRTASLSPRTSL